MLTWVVATVYRLYVPEAPLRSESDSVVRLSPRLRTINVPVAVGAREIKENQRRQLSASTSHYSLSNGLSSGVPSDWVEDVWRRRN